MAGRIIVPGFPLYLGPAAGALALKSGKVIDNIKKYLYHYFKLCKKFKIYYTIEEV
jgi:hypothetical protein